MPSGIVTPEALEAARSLDIDNQTNGVIPTEDEVQESYNISIATGWDQYTVLHQRNFYKEQMQGSATSKLMNDFVPAVKNAWERGKITAEQAEVMKQYRRTFDDTFLMNYDELEEQKKIIPRDEKAEDMLTKFATYGAENIPLALKMLERGALRGAQGLAAGVAAGALTGPAAPVMMPQLGIAGFMAAGKAGIAEGGAELMGALYLKQLLDNGHTLENAVLMSDAVGLIDGLIEVSGMTLPFAFKRIPGVKSLIGRTAVNSFNAVQSKIRRVFTPIIEGGKDISKEYAEEIAQEITELAGVKFLDEWDGPAYQEYIETMKSTGQLPLDHNSWKSLGIELINSAGPAFYGTVGMMTPGVVVQTTARTGLAVGGELTARPTVPTFKTSDEVDAWTKASATEADIPTLVEMRDKNYAMSKRYMAEGDMENALRYGQQGAFYREAIENITGLHGQAFKPSRLSVATGYAKNMVTGIKRRLGQQGAITVEWPGYNKEQAIQQRQKLLRRRSSILKNAGSVNNVGKYLRDKGVPGGIADSIKTYIRSEVEKPFMHSIRKSATHAKEYKGLDNGSEWYRRIGFEEIVRNETPEEAAKFFAIVGETSRQSDPLTNLAKAINIWRDYKSGIPMEEIAKRGGLVPEDEMLSLLKDGKKAIRWTEDLVGQEEGQVKLRDFVKTLELAFKDPALLDTYAESVLDFRMGQYFYNEDPVPGGVRRERGKEQIIAIRDYLRKTDDPAFWTTERVQAALWHWVKDDRVKKGQDPDRPQWTFDNAKKRLVGDYYGVDMSEVTESYVRGFVKSVLTDGEMLIYDHYSKHANIKVLDPTNQGTGKPGREWYKQITPGEDRPKFIHLYQGKAQAEREFWRLPRYRAMFKAGKVYDFKKDPLDLKNKYSWYTAKTDAESFGQRDKEMIENGYLGFTIGKVTVVFDPVRAMRMRGFHLSVSGTFSPEQLVDAKANGPEFTSAAMEEISALEAEGKDDEVAAKVREYFLKDLQSPIIDVLQANTADGFWESEAERSIAGMVEAGDKVVLRGKVAKFLNRFWQYAGIMSEYAGEYKLTGKKPQGIQSGQAPSVTLQFKDELPYDVLTKFNENLDAFGIKGSTYDKSNNTLTIHHIKERDFKTGKVEYPARKNRFAGIVENAINWSNLPDHTASQHWFSHTVIEKEDYEQYERIGKEREAELGVGTIESEFFIDPLDLPKHLQERGGFNQLAIIEAEVETGKPKEIGGNLLDPELMDLTSTSKVRVISEDFKEYYFERWTKDGKAVVNTHWQLEGESSKRDPQDLTTFSKKLYQFQDVKGLTVSRGATEKSTVNKMILGERGSVELRKKYFKAIAIKDPVTGIVFEGTEDDIHFILYGRLSEEEQSRISFDDMGFVDWDGEYYTRKEAAEVLGIERAESQEMRHEGMLTGKVKPGVVERAVSKGREAIVEFGERHGVLEKAEVTARTGKSETGAVEFDPSVYRGLGKKAEPWPTKARISDVEEVIDLTEVVGTKSRVRAITGQVKLGTLITTEATVLKKSLERQAAAAREAFIAGKREGVDITTVKLDDLKGKQKERIAALQVTFQEYKDRVKEMKVMARTRREVSKIIEDMKKIGKQLKTIPDPEKSVLEDFFREFDLTKLTVKNRLKLQKTKTWLAENEDSVELPERVWQNLDRLEKTAIRDLTVDEIRDIGNMVKHIYTLAKTKQQIWVNRKQRNFMEALKTSIKEMKPKLVAAGEAMSSLPTRFDKFGKSWETVRNMLGLYQEHYDLVIESLAGPESVLYDVLYKTVKRGIIKQLDYKQKAIAKLQETTGRNFMQEHGVKDIQKWLAEPVRLGKHEITRDQRMALYRHFMNDDNRTAILEGGIGLKTSLDPDAVIEITEDEVLETLAEMSRAELVFAGSAVSDLFEQQGRDLAVVFRERNGYELELVNNYYPKDTMPLGFSSHDFQSKKTIEELKGRVNRIGIEKGMLHHRLGAKLPIYLNGMTEDINNSIHNAGAYIGLEMPLSQASRLLASLKQELPQRYGRETYRVIDKGLRDIAGEWQTFNKVDKIIMKMKDLATTAILGLNPWVMMKQVMSLPMYWRYVDMEYVVKGGLKSIWHPMETSARHKLFSPEYMERVEVGYSRDVADIFKPGKRFLGKKKTWKQHFLGGIQLFDKMAVIPGMQGAVDMVLDQMKDGKLSDQVKVALDITDADVSKLSVGERMRLAYQYADFATQRTQPMFSPEHRSALSRGGPVEKVMTMFGSATNQFLNMIIRDYRAAVVRKDTDANSKLVQSLFLLLVVNPVGIAALDRLRDWWYDREPDEPFAVDWLKNIAGYVFFLRDVVNYSFNKLQGKHYGFGTPVSMFGDLFGDILTQFSTLASSDDMKKRKKAGIRLLEKFTQLALLSRGLPYQTPKLLITGTHKKERKSP